jgi:hypothetical protein
MFKILANTAPYSTGDSIFWGGLEIYRIGPGPVDSTINDLNLARYDDASAGQETEDVD